MPASTVHAVLALEGSFASMLGGAAAAAVVFLRRREQPHRYRPAGDRPAGPGRGGQRAALSCRLAEVQSAVRAEKARQVADEFDRVHSVQRAVDVGSVGAIISAAELRPRIIEAIEHGMKR